MKHLSVPLFVAYGVAAAAILLEPSDAERSTLWDTVLPFIHDIDNAISPAKAHIDSFSRSFEDLGQNAVEQRISIADRLDVLKDVAGEALDIGNHDHSRPNLTIYEYIKSSNYTTKFASLVDEYKGLIDLLNGTDATNYTLFVPVNEAFDGIPNDPKNKPSKEALEALLKYHIGVGEYPASSILTTNTIPTVFEEAWLGGDHQRLRTSVGLSGVRINFYSKVVAANIGATNGVIHAVGSVLKPPPMIGRVLSLFPSEFSTLLLAYEKTNFVQFIHNVKLVGSTVFAPSNNAFSALGPKANAFLFNTEKGRGYLKALLKYHIVANATLYSDAFYDKTGNDVGDEGGKKEHFDLVTLLDGTHISVDRSTFAGFTSIKVNGYAKVSIRDGVGKNGVIHVVDKVPIPPRNKAEASSQTNDLDGQLTVEELVERLDPYMDGSVEPELTGLEL
ncbi:Fasciclin domain [Geosmithia morbida]|uniref:Fasciclin domain n=1 Tax=Geosmithia morbida TaxID=1094350 RepID=A0A9P5D1G0_9HYPO|nr:Fasciclin domain [Geosmithia morbida]KAF4120421.1 Fasciclin domain [Geosmithia morbida]